jgi:hypothetical protein
LTIVYQSSELRQGDLWSRVQPGDSLEFTLSVPSAERRSAVLEIEGFQAGYRTLGPLTGRWRSLLDAYREPLNE